MRLRSLLLLLLATLAGCATQPESCALVPLAAMKLETHDNLMVVTAFVGRQPVRLLVDTGAMRTTLTQAAAARLGLKRDARLVTRSVGIGGASTGWDVLIPGLVLGHTRFPIQHVAVGNFRLDRPGGTSLDGLLGADILLAFDLDIDAPARRLTIYRTRRCPEALPPWDGESAFDIPGVQAQHDRLLVPIDLDGVHGMAFLDTGAQRSTVSAAMAQRLGVPPATLASDHVVMAYGASPQPLAVHLHRFRDLRVGAVRLDDPVLAVTPNNVLRGDALLGGDFLRGRRVWLSFPTRQLFVSAAGAAQLASGR